MLTCSHCGTEVTTPDPVCLDTMPPPYRTVFEMLFEHAYSYAVPYVNNDQAERYAAAYAAAWYTSDSECWPDHTSRDYGFLAWLTKEGSP